MTKHRQDNTFIINHNGMPYHLTPESEPEAGLYKKMLSAYKINPESFEEEAARPAPDSKLVRRAEIQAELSRIDTEYRTLRTLADAATGSEWALERLVQADTLSKLLREELKEL